MTDNDQSTDDWFSERSATFGDRMTGAREALGMSQADLARRLGVKLKTVHAWEEDLSEPRANKLQMLAGVLNVSIMWLLNGEGDGLDGPAEESALGDDARALLTDIRQAAAEIGRLSDRLCQLEKKLRAVLKEQG